DNAMPLAGGQSLMPMLNFRVVAPDHLVDLNLVAGLSYIDIKDGAGRFGAMTRQRDIEVSADVAKAFPALHEALNHVGHRHTPHLGALSELRSPIQSPPRSAAAGGGAARECGRARRVIPAARSRSKTGYAGS